MTNNCSLSSWETNSRIEHAVAQNIAGPYKKKGVAVNTWAHNPVVLRLPRSEGYALMHIGTGAGPADGGGNCSHRSSNASSSARGLAAAAAGSTIHVSDSLAGPWSPLLNSTLGPSSPRNRVLVFAARALEHQTNVKPGSLSRGKSTKSRLLATAGGKGAWHPSKTLHSRRPLQQPLTLGPSQRHHLSRLLRRALRQWPEACWADLWPLELSNPNPQRSGWCVRRVRRSVSVHGQSGSLALTVSCLRDG